MKQYPKKLISLAIALALVFSLVPVLKTPVRAVSVNQQNIADRADFFFNTTWVCQKTINGWRDQYTFYEGETYRLPYGQPVNSGKFIGYGVELEEFVSAAADVNSVFYAKQSEFNGWTSVYYATDCAAFVAMCWGTVRQDCSTLPYYSTYMGAPTESNIHNILQLGDALDSTSVGHVVLVTDLTYDRDGTLIQIEITEQTPPQLKRTYFTPEELAEKYAAEFGIYRYMGSVPAVPEWGYTTECTNYASNCRIEITQDTPIMSLPCASAVNNESKQLGLAEAGHEYIATRMYENTVGDLWYRISTPDKQDGYIAAEHTIYREYFTDDIGLSDAAYPNALVKGSTFSLVGNLYSKYNQLVTAATYIYKDLGTNSTAVTGYSDYVTSNAYTLKNSTVDYNTSFGTLTAGLYTIAISGTYKNYYATGRNTYEVNSGTINLAEEYFMVVSSSTNQNSCSHSYTQTVMSEGDCVNAGLSVYSCSKCGKVYKQSTPALGHEFSEWSTVIAATCTQDGSTGRSCSVCNEVETQTIPAFGHQYISQEFEGSCEDYPHTAYTCQHCEDSYVIYPDSIMTPWQEVEPDETEVSLLESKTQYRYSAMEIITAPEAELEGYMPLGETWEADEPVGIDYVKSWPTGFDRENALYAQYHVEPLTAVENENEKTVIDSDSVTGYLYYHWCYANSYFSKPATEGQYTIFHAYYSTTPPSSYRVDESDWSYCTADSGCSNTQWYFVAEVNTQTSTHYHKLYQHGRWQEFSEWDDSPVEATDTRQVETRTVYRYADNKLLGHEYESTVVSPSCTEDGMTVYSCRLCGSEYIDNIIPATGHEYETIVTAPTCTENGSTTYHCTVCGDVYTEDDIPATGHDYESTVTPPTCTESGSTAYRCTVCGDAYTGDDIPAAGHDYVSTVIPPTCTESGSTTYCCTVCGDAYTEDDTPATGHDYESTVIPPTCTESGSTTYCCTVCGDAYTEDDTPATGHDYESTVTPPTCTESGSTTYCCTVCGDAYTESNLPATGHDMVNGTCQHCGFTEEIELPVIVPKYPTISFEDEIFVNVYFTVTDSNAIPTESMGMLTWSTPQKEGTIEDAEALTQGATLNQANGFYSVQSQGIPAKNLGDTVYCKIYIKLADGSYIYSRLLNYSPKSYAQSILSGANYAPALKTLVVSMLNYGAAAQTYFGYKTDSLVNSTLSDENLSLVQPYNPEMLDAIKPADKNKPGAFASTKSGFSRGYPTISFEGAFSINYYFAPSQTVADDVVLYVWNQSDYTNNAELWEDNASAILTMSGEGEYWAAITDIAAKDIDKTSYVCAVYTDAQGHRHCSGVIAYSLGSYCVSQAAGTGSIAPFAAATAVYGHYAKAYFEA